MTKKSLVFTIFILLSLPGIAFADVALPLHAITVLLSPLIVLIEIGVFYAYLGAKHKKLRGIKSSVLKGKSIIFIVILANIATAMLGAFFVLRPYLIDNLIILGIAFVLSFVVEWGIYILYFRKSDVSIRDSCIISCAGNILTYLIICLPPVVWDADSPYAFDRVSESAAKDAVFAAYNYYYDFQNDSEDKHFNINKLKVGGYKDPERNVYGITLKQNVRITVSGDIDNLKITTWHDKGEHIFTVDSNGKIHKKLKTGETNF